MFGKMNRLFLLKRRVFGMGLLLSLISVGCTGNSPKLMNRGDSMKDLEWGKTVAGYRLSASLDRAAFKPHEAVVVTVVFENVTDRDLPYGAQGKDFDYTLDCRNEQENQVPFTLFGQRMKANRGQGRYITAELPPKECLVNEISVSRHLDLSLSGKYTLTVSREIFPHQNQNEPPVVSNTLAFEIE
jgi:hypothetical protein